MKKNEALKPNKDQLEAQKRFEEFDKEFEALQKKYKVKMYAANQAFQTGEVMPIIKLADMSNQEVKK